jgi:hypothetical protein
VFTWKYIDEEYGGVVDHERIVEELSSEYGDRLLAGKGVDPHNFKPGVAYHYVWVPFLPVLPENDKYKGKTVEYQIIDCESKDIVAEGDAAIDKGILVPYGVGDYLVRIDGTIYQRRITSVGMGLGKDNGEKQIKEVHWSYGEGYKVLNDNNPRHYTDLNVHIKTANYNDGDNVEITLNIDDGDYKVFGFKVNATVYDNMAVVKDVFKERMNL